MMDVIEDLPSGVIGVRAHGKITHDDYEKVLAPMLESALDAQANQDGTSKISFLYVIEGFDGAEVEAVWDDTKLGIRHWNDFERIALVTDIDWMKNMTKMFAWMIPAEVKVLHLADIEEATKWVSGN